MAKQDPDIDSAQHRTVVSLREGEKVSEMIIQAHGVEEVSRQQSRRWKPNRLAHSLTELRSQRSVLGAAEANRICWAV